MALAIFIVGQAYGMDDAQEVQKDIMYGKVAVRHDAPPVLRKDFDPRKLHRLALLPLAFGPYYPICNDDVLIKVHVSGGESPDWFGKGLPNHRNKKFPHWLPLCLLEKLENGAELRIDDVYGRHTVVLEGSKNFDKHLEKALSSKRE